MKRVLFSLYAAVGFVVVSAIPTFYNPKIYDALEESDLPYWWNSRPDYALDYYILLLAVPLSLLIYFGPEIIRIVGISDNAITRPIYIFVCFFATVLASLLNFKVDPILPFWGLCYGGIFAVVDALDAYVIDFGFVEREAVPTQAKIAKLRMMFDKWFKGVGIFTGALIALAISGGIHFFTFNPGFLGREASVYANTAMIIELLYIAPGIGIGIYGNIFRKINTIEAQHLRIRSGASEDVQG